MNQRRQSAIIDQTPGTCLTSDKQFVDRRSYPFRRWWPASTFAQGLTHPGARRALAQLMLERAGEIRQTPAI